MEEKKREKFFKLYEEFYNFCFDNGLGDPFNYSRAKEIYLSLLLNHTIADKYSGEDAINENGEKVEYKSTINDKVTACYNGISVFPTWEEQEEYLKNKKIGIYKEHFFARFESGKVVEVYKCSGNEVLKRLIFKLKERFFNDKKKNKKDPRLGVTFSEKEIKNMAKRIL